MKYDCRAFAFLTEFPDDASHLLMQGYEAGLFNTKTTVYLNAALLTPQTYTALVVKHGVESMRGVFSLAPMIQGWKASVNGQAFLSRYISQPNSVTILPNNTQICHVDQDDTGNYLYKSLNPFTGMYECTGMIFNTLHQDGHDGSTYMGFVYDATMAYFHAVDFLVKSKQITLDQVRTKNTPLLSGTNIKSVLVNNVSFTGVTGQVSFSKGLAGSKIFGYGDRETGQGFVIYNWQYTNTSMGLFKRVARWTSELGYMDCLHDNYKIPIPLWMGGCHLPISYNSPDGISVPVDRLEDFIQLVPPPLKGFLLAIAAFTFVTAMFIITVLYVVKAQTRLVKASQPAMMMYILVGVIFAAIRIALAGFDPTDGLCHVDIWSGHLAFAGVFFAMILKAWRVHKIVLGGLRRVKITSFQVMCYNTVLISIVAIILVIYSAIGHPHVEYVTVPMITGNNLQKPYCTTDMPGFDYVLYAIEGDCHSFLLIPLNPPFLQTIKLTHVLCHNNLSVACALMVATYLCYKTKDTPDAVNESKFIALAVFLIVFISIAGLPIVLSLPLDPYLSQMIIGLGFFIATMGANGFYFGQKMFYLLQGADLNAQFKLAYSNGKLAESSSEKKRKVITLAQEQVDAENTSDSIMKTITPDVKSAFLSHDVRSFPLPPNYFPPSHP